MTCLPCRRGFHDECENNESTETNRCGCVTCNPELGKDSEGSDNGPDESIDWRKGIRANRSGSHDRSLKDQQSTGRKRAARLYPILPETNCEWQGLKYAGGGEQPIVGCIKGVQQARHHGPDKNTLNNEKGNVHRICHNCHNRWHSKNDADYDWTGTHHLHDANTKATLDELLDAELFWTGVKVKAVVD